MKTNRFKKPPVKPELRLEWLRRNEEYGESPPQIAKADHYDVRTVRKQLEIARQERERREARFVVMRQALEKHYADLVGFAKQLDLALTSDLPISSTLKTHPMWIALKEHMPRSSMWRGLAKWDVLCENLAQLEEQARDPIKTMIEEKSPLPFAKAADQVGLGDGIIQVLAFHLKAKAKGEHGLDYSNGFIAESWDDKATVLRIGWYGLGTIPNEMVNAIKGMVIELFEQAVPLEEHEQMKILATDRDRIKQSLREELQIIILRRIVPGRCRFCPI